MFWLARMASTRHRSLFVRRVRVRMKAVRKILNKSRTSLRGQGPGRDRPGGRETRCAEPVERIIAWRTRHPSRHSRESEGNYRKGKTPAKAAEANAPIKSAKAHQPTTSKAITKTGAHLRTLGSPSAAPGGAVGLGAVSRTIRRRASVVQVHIPTVAILDIEVAGNPRTNPSRG